MAFSPRGHLLATTGDDYTVRLWDWDTADACEAAAAYVAPGQLEPYLPEGWEPACRYGE
jgi:WD40 repeat protein